MQSAVDGLLIDSDLSRILEKKILSTGCYVNELLSGENCFYKLKRGLPE